MRDDRVNHVRHFNRTVAQRIGALSDNFLATHRPMAEARLLWEIGEDGCEVRTLRNRLGLDSGHAENGEGRLTGVARVGEKGGLAHPRFPDEQHRVAVPGRGSLEQPAQASSLFTATDHG